MISINIMNKLALPLLLISVFSLAGCDHGYFLIEQGQRIEDQEEEEERYQRTSKRLNRIEEKLDTLTSTEKSISSPQSAIVTYYELINQGRYEEAWSNLSFEFKQKSSSYSEYDQWWDSVESVNVSSVNLIEKTDRAAAVNAKITYFMKDGRHFTQPSEIIVLVLNSDGKWLFYDKRESP